MSGSSLLCTATAESWNEQFPSNLVAGDEYFLNRGTPGRTNSRNNKGLPPFVNVEEIKQFPEKPASTDMVTITAKVTSNEMIAGVSLDYEVYVSPYQMPAQTNSVTMYDVVVHGDGEAGDGIYGFQLAALASQTLVRYRISVEGLSGCSWTYPDEKEPNPNRAFFVYDGEVETNLPVYYLIIPEAGLDYLNADIWTHDYQDATLVLEGKTYDHIGIHYRGRGYRRFPKKSWKIKFNKTEYFHDMSTLDLAMHTPVLQKLVFDLFWLMGQEHLATELVRLHMNGSFYGLYLAQESLGPSWLKKNDMDEESHIFKASCDLNSTSTNADLTYQTDPGLYPKMYERRNNPLGSFDKLMDFTDGITNLPEEQIFDFINDNVDLNNWLYRWAVQYGIGHVDYRGQNYLVLVPEAPEGKWQIYYYDFDLAFGCNGIDEGSVPCMPYTYDWYDTWWDLENTCAGNRCNARCRDNPALRNRFLVILKDTLENYMTEETIDQRLDELFAMTANERPQEIALWGTSPSFIIRDHNVTGIKQYFSDRSRYLLSWIDSQGISLPDNEHPVIDLKDPVAKNSGIEIAWTYTDAEDDDCTVDLYWTDKKWSNMEPIEEGSDLPAESGGFLWVRKIPDDLSARDVYIHAVIKDHNSYLVGRDTSEKPIEIYGDFNSDGTIDMDDLVVFADNWLKCTDPRNPDCNISQGGNAPSLPDPVLWLKADAGVVYDGSNKVSQWIDQSANGHNAVQSVYAKQPTWENIASGNQLRPALHFNNVSGGASESWLENSSFALRRPFTQFIVMKSDRLNSYDTIPLDGNVGFVQPWQGRGLAYFNVNDTMNVFGGVSPYPYWDGPAHNDSTTNWHFVASVARADGTSYNRVDGVEGSSGFDGGNDYETGYLVGTRQDRQLGFEGLIAEIIIYSGELTNEEIQVVEEYLHEKYFVDILSFNPLVWFKADEGVATDFEGVVAWYDQSGNNNHADRQYGQPQLVTAAFPTGNLAVMQFDGDDGFRLTDPAFLRTSSISIYAVISVAEPSDYQVVFSHFGDSLGYKLGICDPYITSFFTAPTGGSLNAAVECVADHWYLLTATINGSTNDKAIKVSYEQTNTATGSVTYTAGSQANIGALYDGSEFLSGDIAEILVFDSVDAQQQVEIEEYLVKKFGLIPTPKCGDAGFLIEDVNEDCYIDFQDFLRFAQNWLW